MGLLGSLSGGSHERRDDGLCRIRRGGCFSELFQRPEGPSPARQGNLPARRDPPSLSARGARRGGNLSTSPCSVARSASFCAASVPSRTARQHTIISATSWQCSTPSSSRDALSPGSLH